MKLIDDIGDTVLFIAMLPAIIGLFLAGYFRGL